ncbi:leucine--tRNA ligase [Adhaeribacter radiodurans]|uniref:Leucine--tRNA ligase n=1 Tax=Adhaeribacter radiodurans TaxID=2745197 RepID=A0A7L7L647_9BACT|nr:class I tRNA ligase family protein [Adhaeribacter radiodurans]QMU28306.1 leucine--tRNA ligase [Adhaeribacter radiodurans]
MSDYNFNQIEKKWQQYWNQHQTFRVSIDPNRPKYYVLDMFPYPSGAGLHVGHPLGYIASDIVARYKRIKGFNVLHPMGFDAFGLPAEQYAIQTGQHPAITTEQNITRYKEQLANLGFSFDWNREVRTSDPSYYKWTQWIFLKLFDSWYNQETNKAEPIATLLHKFKNSGNATVKAACNEEEIPDFTASQWQQYSEKQQQEILLNYRLAFLSDATVNWCPALGTVLANDEVKDGVSERGGYPVIRQKMKQWSLRISAYAERLLNDLDHIDWTDPIKEMQRNWIGKSIGAELNFKIKNSDQQLKVFTTRPDTIYGVSFLVIAPEHEWVPELTTPDQKKAVEEYVNTAKNRSERDRMSDVKHISGVFTGSYVINPINGEEVPLWIADYVLAGYGTGVVMAVPASDSRDFNFAKHFNLPIIPVIEGSTPDEVYEAKEGILMNSGFLNGLAVKEAIKAAVAKFEELGVGKGKVQYRIHDAVFGRQRYWGEPIPIYYKDDIAYPLPESELPLILPEIDAFLPTETGEPPLGRAKDWNYQGQYHYELTTMPGWAGSSWYYLRYMSPENKAQFVTPEAEDYWGSVDLYIGGSEHATGHLLYSRFWYKFLKDLGLVSQEEPFKKLINQGMIQGRSNIVYKQLFGLFSNNFTGEEEDEGFPSYHFPSVFVSKHWYNVLKENDGKQEYESLLSPILDRIKIDLKEKYPTKNIEPYLQVISPQYVDVNIVENDILDLEAFKAWRSDLSDAEFILEDGKYICGWEIEKMSKSKYNVVNPDDLVHKVGADTLRMYEMFLGPLEQFKPWNTNGIDGVHKFLKRYWKLFFDANGVFYVSDEDPTPAELKTLHKTIKKVEEDIERFSFNTSVSTFMICVNELTALKCNKRAILEPLTIALSPYAPHISEELWHLLGHVDSISYARFPQWQEQFLTENSFEYPISVNGKMRGKLTFPTNMPKELIEQEVVSSGLIDKYLEGKTPKKVIVVPNKIVNVVV